MATPKVPFPVLPSFRRFGFESLSSLPMKRSRIPRTEVFMNRWTMVLCSTLVGITLSSVAWAAKTPDGKPVFLKYKCNMCHSIEAIGVEKKALPDDGATTSKLKPPDLSSVGLDKKADWIALFMQKK